MSLYRIQPGDSPGRIARKLNTSVASLFAANPHKARTVVAGKHTWQNVGVGENVHIPRAGVGVGAIAPAAPGAPHAMIKKGSSGADVALWQTIIGATADGAFGPKTDTLTRSWQGTHGLAADGIVGPKTWAAALGAGAPVTVATPAAAPAPVAASSNLAGIANSALSALRSDPNYCTNVAKTGTAVNTAVHNFKAAWNSANPSRAVPIGTGKYEVSVAAALWSALGGTVDVPPGCGAAGVPAAAPPAPVAATLPPSVTMPAPSGAPPPPPMVTPSAPAASNIPAAVQALASIDPCDQANSGLVTQAQKALGVSADGKYGNDTSNAARRMMPNAPAGCSPRPMWWAPPGQTNAPGSGGGAAPPAMPPQQAAPPPSAPQPSAGGVTPPSGGGSSATITMPAESKKLSTGAIVAGAVGVAAVVGLLAAAAMSKKTGHRGSRGARGPSRRKSKRKSAHRSKRKSKR
jgi:peptidoglycan hydrolase-like protein with peptidoglycan-binding domain